MSSVRHVQFSELEALERSLERLKAELDLFQTQFEAVGHADPTEPDTAPSDESWIRLTAKHLQTQRESWAALQAEVELLKQHQGQELHSQQGHGSHALWSELEALLEAQAQQLRLLQSQRQQTRQTQDSDRLVLEKQIETLQAALERAEQRIREVEAQSLESRTWAISVNVQRQIAQEHMIQLQATLNERRSQLKALTAELEDRQESLATQRRLAESQTTVIMALQRDLSTAHRTLEALEKQLLNGSRQQAGIIQLRRESELQRRSEQSRQRLLEEERAAHQETIAQQAEQIRRLEAQIQEWRQRSLVHQHQLQNVKDWMEQWGDNHDLPDALRALLTEESFPELLPRVEAFSPPQLSASSANISPALPVAEEKERGTGSVISFPLRPTAESETVPETNLVPQPEEGTLPPTQPTTQPKTQSTDLEADAPLKAEKDILELPRFPQ